MNTLNYSEQFNLFQSVITDIEPEHYIDFDGSIFYISNNGNIYSIEDQNNSSGSSYLRFIVNEDFTQTKIFDNIELYSGDGNDIYIIADFKTATQSSLSIISHNIGGAFSKRESTYYAALPRNAADGVTRLRDKFLMCNYSIRGISGSRDFSIPYIKTKYRYSII